MILSCNTCPSERQGSMHSTMTVGDGNQSTPRKSRSLTPTRPSILPRNALVSTETRWNAAKDAAQLGQFTRLREHVVESVGTPKETEQDSFWIKSGLHMNTQRSSMFQIITEAAALGSLRLRKPVEIVTNDKSPKSGDNDDVENDGVNEKSIKRQFSSMDSSIVTTTDDPTELVNTYVEFQRARKQEQLMDPEQFLERIELHEKLGEKWKTMDVELPTSTIPRFEKPTTYITEGRLRGMVVRNAAEEATARQERMVLQGIFKVHQSCKCVYCKNPTPFQTQSYQKLRVRQGWTDDSLEAEQSSDDQQQNAVSNSSINRRPSFTKSRAKRTYRRQTLAMILSSTTAPSRSKSEPEPSIPSFFKGNAASKHHVKAWKTRAAQAKRELCGKEHHVESNPFPPFITAPGAQWVSPRHRKDKLQLGEKSNLPVFDSIQNPVSTTIKGDHTFVSPRSAQKAKLTLPLGSASIHGGSSKPIWADTKLRSSTIKDPQGRNKDLDGSCHTPAWIAAKDLLVPVSPQRRKNDCLTMTEHSPLRARLSPATHRSKSFDGEIDEEALLHQELDLLTLESPQRRTVKATLSPTMFTTNTFGTRQSSPKKVVLCENDDDESGGEDDDDDDFAC